MYQNDRIEEELLPFYALGALTEEEQAEVEAYLDSNPAARARFSELSQGVEALAMTVAPITPPTAVKSHLMERVVSSQPTVSMAAPARAARPTPKSTKPAKPRRQWFSWPTAAWAFSLLLVFGLGWAALSFRGQLGSQQSQVASLQATVDELAASNDALQSQLAQQQTQVTAALDQIDTLTTENTGLREELISQSQQLAFYREPGTVAMSIGSISDSVPDATATLVRNPAEDSITMRANNLPELDKARVYQLWLIADGVPISAGVFDAGADGQATLVIPGGLPAGLQGIGISVEPSGGSFQPTPDQIILFGEVAS